MRRWLAPLAALCAPLLAACPSLDLSANHYACERDAGDAQCPNGWHCGQQGWCYDRAAAGAVPCEQGANDCADDWRCDLQTSTCRPRTPGPYACTSDELCEGWRCGIDGVCHPREAGTWPCAQDTDCEASWRCGAGGRCLDPSREALQFERFPDAGTATLTNPLVFTELPRQLSASDWRTDAGVGNAGRIVVAVGEPEDGGLTPMKVVVLGVVNDQTTGNHLVTQTVEWPFPVTAAGIGWEGLAVLGEVKGPQLTVVTSAPDGGLTPVYARATSANLLRTFEQHLWTGAWRTGYLAFARGSPDLLYASLPGGVEADLTAPLVDGGTANWDDVTYLERDFGLRGLLAATDQGLYYVDFNPLTGAVAQNGKGEADWCAFNPKTVEALFPQGGLFFTLNTYALRARWPLLAVQWDQSLSGGGPTTDVLNTRFALLQTTLEANGACSGQVPGAFAMDLCDDPCLAFNLRPVDFAPVKNSSAAGLEVRCGLPNASVQQRTFVMRRAGLFDSRCVTDEVQTPLGSEALMAAPSSQDAVYLGEHGQLWSGASPSSARPFTLDRAPLDVARLDGGIYGVLEDGLAVRDVAGGAGWVVTTRDVPAYYRVQEPVKQRPGWYVFPGANVLSTEPRATPDGGVQNVVAYPAEPQSTGPFHAVAAPRQDGGVHLVVTAFDQVLGATVLEGDTQPVPLELKLIPFVRTPIRSVAALDVMAAGDGGTALSGGYVMTRDQLWRFWAETDRRWRLGEVSVPAGELLEVWRDGADRARVGYEDGRIYSLPSALLLAPQLPGDEVAVDFEDVCGQPWLLSDRALYRLVHAGSAVGEWSQVPLSIPGEASALGAGFRGGRLIYRDGVLYLGTAFGAVAEVQARCAGGTP